MLPATTLRDRPRPRPRVRLAARAAWRHDLGAVAVRLAVPAAVLAAGWSLVAFGRGEGAETGFLSILAAGVLAGVAALTARPGAELGVGSTLAVLLLWVLPAGPLRGGALTLLLFALLGLAAVRRWGRILAPDTADEAPSFATLTAAWVPVTVGLQLLLRSDRLVRVAPDLATAAVFLGLPILAAVALAALARRHGVAGALVAGATVALLSPGWDPTVVLALLALAAGGELLCSDPLGLEGPGAPLGRTAWAVRAVALAALIAPFAWQQRTGVLAVTGALVLGLFGRWARGERGRELPAWGCTLPALMAALGAAFVPLRSWAAAGELAVWLVLLVPGLALAARSRRPLAGAALLLALAAGWAAPDLAGLTVPVVLAALALPPAAASRLDAPAPHPDARQPAAGGTVSSVAVPSIAVPSVWIPQGIWSAALLATGGLAAAYPWLRDQPLTVAGRLFGWLPAGVLPAAAVAVVVLLALAALHRGLGVSPCTVAALATAVPAVLLVLQLPPALAGSHPGGQTLDRGQPVFRCQIPRHGIEARHVVLDTHLAHAADLEAGTPVATVRRRDAAGRWAEAVLRVGEGTGEWAVNRPDLAQRDLATPAPWLSQVVAAEDGEWFLAHRYRAALALEEVSGPAGEPSPEPNPELIVERRADLPPEVRLALFHLELRP